MTNLLETIIKYSILIYVLGILWGGLSGQQHNPYFYSLPLKKKILSFYLPFGMAIIGFLGFLLSFISSLILSIIYNLF